MISEGSEEPYWKHLPHLASTALCMSFDNVRGASLGPTCIIASVWSSAPCIKQASQALLQKPRPVPFVTLHFNAVSRFTLISVKLLCLCQSGRIFFSNACRTFCHRTPFAQLQFSWLIFESRLQVCVNHCVCLSQHCPDDEGLQSTETCWLFNIHCSPSVGEIHISCVYNIYQINYVRFRDRRKVQWYCPKQGIKPAASWPQTQFLKL